MRPLKLTLQAFGSYLDKTEIDLTKFGEQGIYLITGKTGSGKTTIFDAIIYALFDSASGTTRDKTKRFRSGFASKYDDTFVELEFENAGEIYKVRRNPEYMRAAKRGDGETKQDAGSELFIKDNNEWISLCEKNINVNSKIVSIIGVNKNQFTQMAMLAQGEFQKLLTVESQDRKKILEQIFNTQKYALIQDRISKEFNELVSMIKEKKVEIGSEVSRIMVDSNEETDLSELENIKRMEEYDIASIKALLSRIIEKDRKLVGSSSEVKNNLNDKLISCNNNLKDCKDINEKLAKLAELSEGLKLIEGNILDAESKKNVALNKKPEADSMMAEVTLLTNLLDDYEKLDSAISLINKLAEENKESIEKVKRLEEKQASLNADLDKINGEKSSLPNIISEKAKLEVEKNTLTQKHSGIEELQNNMSEYSKVKAEHNRLTNEYNDAKDKYTEIKSIYEHKSNAFLEAQAGIIASSLEEGKKCPVCGSVHHPEIAHLSEETPKEDEVEQARVDKEDAEENKNNILTLLTALASQIDEKKSNIFVSASKLFNVEFTEVEEIKNKCDDELPKIESSLKPLLEKISQLNADIDRINKLDSDIIESQIKEIKTIIESEEQLQSKNKESIATNEGIIEQIESRFIDGPKSKDEANNKINELNEKARAIELEIEKAKEAVENLNSDKATKEGAISELKSQTKDKSYTDIEPLEQEIEKVRNEINDVDNQNKLINTRLTSNEIAFTKIDNIEVEKAELDKKYGWLKQLRDTATGQVVGKDKIDLSLYAVTEFFNHILDQANIRFERMTSGQFTLVRGEEAEDGRTKTGLDIMVEDHYNGELRSVKTLSGGEIFKAALSFALGMSDEISNSTGIVIDSLFVDEGFGSLDEESIPQAINTLYELASENRLIGIISHIDEVKQNIDKQIVVTKDTLGISNVKLVY